MEAPLDRVKSISARGWNKAAVNELKNELKQAEVEPGIPFQSYLSDLCSLRFLLLYSELEEAPVRLLYHRYLHMKQQAVQIQDKLPQIAEFLMLYGNLRFSSMSAFVEKEIQGLSADLSNFGKLVRRNYRVNLWALISAAYAKIKTKELSSMFGVKNVDELIDEGFKIKNEGDYCSLDKIEESEDHVEQCEVQMKILQQVISNIESNKA